MKKRLLALFLAFVMAMSLLPVSVFADGVTGVPLQGTKNDPITANSNGVTVNKYVSVDEEGNYSLTLEAYAENKVTSTTTTTPLDIVLVLDTSGSMDYNFGGESTNNDNEKRITALKTAVSSFIDEVAKNAAETNADHQISIVKFAGKESNEIGNKTYAWGYNYSQIVTRLTPVTGTTGAEKLKDHVSALIAGGATRADYGMAKAKEVLQREQRNSEKVVIMFTDGVPTSGTDYEASVAHGAVNTAKELKDAGVTVYTIGIFSGADPSDTSTNANEFMNAVSSKYPNAKSEVKYVYDFPVSWDINLGSRGEGQYYFASDSASGLEDVFNTIANTVTSSTLKVNPDEEAVLSDTLSDYFKFPNGLTGENPKDVTVQKVPVTGKNSGGYTWGEAETVTGATVTGKTIEVTGFNYKENAVTEETKNGKTTYSGCKLVVTFPIKIDTDACNKDTTITNGYYPTNSEAKLSYKKSAASTTNDTTQTTLSDSPKVSYTKPEFTVKWMSQDGRETLETDTSVAYGAQPTFGGTEPTKESDAQYVYTFVGWATSENQENGTVESQLPTVTGNVTYYAAFSKTARFYTLSYDANAQDGTVTNMPENPADSYSSGDTVNLDSKVPSHTDVDKQKVVFIGWSKTKSDKIYSAGESHGTIVDKVTFEDRNITVYAVWGYDTNNNDDGHHSNYTLYYHSNFGEDVSFYQSSSTRNVTVKEYDDVGRLLERDGYVFVSWNTEPDGSGERYMPGDTFHIDGSSDHLYAQWQKDKTGPDDSGVSNWLETDEHRAYLTGYPDSTFRADRNMTRAEVAQMFYALLLDKNVTITKSFSDVPDDAWYATAVKTLASLGMMDGYPDGTFRPDEPITRAEFATVGLAFAYDPLDADCSYYDVSASAWYHTYVAQATTYGWIGGYPDNTFRPGNNITRVEVCVIVNNMLGRDADERYIDRHEDELVHFVDLSDSYWGYYTIMEATNTHEYTGSFTNEKWTDVK